MSAPSWDGSLREHNDEQEPPRGHLTKRDKAVRQTHGSHCLEIVNPNQATDAVFALPRRAVVFPTLDGRVSDACAWASARITSFGSCEITMRRARAAASGFRRPDSQ